MRGWRVTQSLALAAVIAACAALWLALPANANPEECGPYTRSQLEADRASTTTTVAIDPVETVPGRGVEVDEDAAVELLPEESQPEPPAPDCPEYVHPIEFPVVGGGVYGSGFGAPRDGGARLHMGVDLMAPKMTPVVAAADATVAFVRDDESRCCYLGLTHEDGWESWYIHLNNDTYGTDDGEGVGIRPDLAPGDEVRAGELIGWVGDSGNAETTDPHLHFELHMPSGEPVDAWPSVREAARRAALAVVDEAGAVFAGDTDEGELHDLVMAREEGGPRADFVGPFVDDEGSAAEPLFAALVAGGVSPWCDPWGIRVCPGEPALGEDAEAWVAAMTGTQRDPSVSIAYPAPAVDPDLERSLDCSVAQFCPGAPVTAGEVAAMIIGASDGSSVLGAAEAAERLAKTVGDCGPLSDEVLNREELAELLLRWRIPPEAPCDESG